MVSAVAADLCNINVVYYDIVIYFAGLSLSWNMGNSGQIFWSDFTNRANGCCEAFLLASWLARMDRKTKPEQGSLCGNIDR